MVDYYQNILPFQKTTCKHVEVQFLTFQSSNLQQITTNNYWLEVWFIN